MPASDIVVKGAREHNLRDINLVLPRNQLICLTGVSGSGKSSLAFDTLYAEGQRRYVESLSSYARQFLGQMPKPEVDFIGGLSPSISISQKSAGNNPRSTVGTITEIYDYLRVLFARVGLGHCPSCNREITAQSREEILGRILGLPEGTKFSVLAPLIRRQKGEYKDLFEDLSKQGFARARVDGEVHSLSDQLRLDRQMRHNIEVVVDRLTAGPSLRPRLAEAVDLALRLGKGNLLVALDDPSAAEEANRPASKTVRPGDIVFSADYACTHCGLSFEPPSPQLFSFNSPQGMCDTCDGLGEVFSFDPSLLVPKPDRNFQQGCIELVGSWKAMGRWRRHIYQGVADTVERIHGLEAGTMLETAWEELPKELRDVWLWGTGEEHITFTWRGGNSPHKHGGLYEGIIPELITKYRNCNSSPQIKQLEKYMNTISCPDCLGERLNPQARAVSITSGNKAFVGRSLARDGGVPGDDGKKRDLHTLTLPEVCRLSVVEATEFFQDITLGETQAIIASEVLKEIRGRLSFLLNVGLDYLSLNRTAPTLSGGESQRIRLAGQIGCGLVGVLYILDEPSIGLHPRDNDRLLESLAQLRDQGNTVLVVEHDEDTIRAADHVIDFGPGPGVRGGEVVAEGTVAKVLATENSVTGQFLSGRRKIEFDHRREVFGPAPSEEKAKKKRKKATEKPAKPAKGLKYAPPSDEAEDDTVQKWLTIRGATHNNLKGVDVSIPLGRFVVVTGVSGSGKSSLVSDILAETLFRDLNGGDGHPGAHDDIEGMEHLDKLISIDQTPIGRTPRSNPGTYIKVFDEIRHLFTQMPESKKRGYKPGRFSFNVKGGRCEACEGNGSTRLEMDFLADVWVTCPVCQGHRFNRETLGVQFKGKSISQVLEMDIQQALELFENQPKIRTKLQTLHDVGLDYMKLGQPSPTLSGGEAQRIKLARQLVKRSTGRTLYLLDEPTTGLHFADIDLLLKVLHGFADGGNTVLVVEHNLDVIKTADWIIDVGPEGGEGGGQIIATGTPEQIAANPNSHTGQALAKVIKVRAAVEAGLGKETTNGKPVAKRHQPQSDIIIRGAHQHNLKHVDATIQRDRMTVFCGPSGSGKSSLAMDTLYAEGQRRYVESLSSYARQFVSQMQKPAVEHVEGLSPAIAIEQKNLSSTPRSTVGTVTEVYDYFRILLARLGTPHCPDCNLVVGTQTADEVIDKIMAEPTGTRMYLMAPVEVEVGRQYETMWDELRQRGYLRIRVDGQTHTLDKPPTIDRRRKHAVEVIIDRITVQDKDRGRIAESVEAALALGRGVMHVVRPEEGRDEEHWPVQVHSQHLACQKCGRSFEALSPHNFSFNSPLGWCEACEGLGIQTGTNPAALLRDSKLTLAQGALALWPNVANPVSQAMLAALGQGANIPLEVPFDQLTARDRRLIFHGTGDQWFTATCPWPADKPVIPTKKKAAKKKTAKAVDTPLTFKFQFKGLYPALEEASRLAPALRARLERMIDEVECSACAGSRLRDDAAAVQFHKLTIDDWARLPLGELVTRVEKMDLSAREKKIAGELIREITARSQFLVEVGLEYLTLARGAATLSGGEAQRIRLASQLGSGLTGVLYVLDEPTIGLHPRDNTRLLGALYKLRDLGNTLVLVEHDREVIAGSDALCDFGPGAGRLGGEIVARGTPAEIATQERSVTGPYLAETKAIPVPTNRRLNPAAGDHTAWLDIVGARHNNLRDVNISFPLGTLTAVTGVSGSGKSSLVEDVLYATLARTLHRAGTAPGAHDALRGIEHVNKVIRVDQQALGNSPSSNPATFTGAFELIRQLFAQLPESKVRGYTARQFSFNVAGGRCEACEGNGQLCIEMHFLPDVWVECDTCKGRRYNPETLAVKYHGHSIADVLEMTCGDALRLMANIPKIRRILQTLCDVGLDYLQLGQPAPTLSGGEAQRVKLASELARPDTGSTLYLLDEPTTGLHFDDLAKLLDVMHRLVDLGNTVVVIEHNLDIIKNADWVVDMGPEAGESGGRLVAAGTPEQIAAHATRYIEETGEGAATTKPTKKKTARKKKSTKAAEELPSAAPEDQPLLRSHTGEALTPVLAAGPYEERSLHDFEAELERRTGDLELAQVGKETKMPWEIDGRQWHTVERVGRRGEPCMWEGKALAEIIDRITDQGEFEVNWGARTIVEITGPKKSDGWFFHAITGEAWLLKLKFRVAKNTFKRNELQQRLPLPTLNDLESLPIYGNQPRVTCKNLRGPWQEVQVNVHTLEEIDTPEFWEFIEQAVAGFNRHIDRVEQNPEDVMPWKVLGQKWHLCRKGFPLGKKVEWEQDVLEELLEILGEAAGKPQYLWNNQQVVHLMVPDQREPWASVRTKLAEAVELSLNGPPGAVALGRIAELGWERKLDQKENRDAVRIRFRTHDDLDRGDLREFLAEHLENVNSAAAR